MYLLLSGEGPGDIGACNPSAESCDTDTFKAGPMAWIVDQLIESFLGYDFSHFQTERVSFVSEAYLASHRQKPVKKAMSLRGKKKPIETKYFFENARALATAAKFKADEVDEDVIAVLFRDSDGTASAGRGNWRDKRNSMINGFKVEEFELGVPMVPKPKSEAWLLCSVKNNPYQGCDNLEEESGNDKAPNPLKKQLSDALKGNFSTSDLNTLVQEKIDLHQIKMPSFNAFKNNLKHVVKVATGNKTEIKI
jgi:hypothetical protein